MSNLIKSVVCVFLLAITSVLPVKASEKQASKKEGVNVKELILDHLSDAYDWHITDWGEKHISIPLPIIVKGKSGEWNIFMSSQFHHGEAEYNGFYISKSDKFKGKIVEIDQTSGEEIRPLDFSLTKNATSLFISSIMLILLILHVADWYKKRAAKGEMEAPKGFIGFMEMFIMNVNDDIIKPCVGKDYKKFAPYLLTVFFFIFFNNLLGLIPIFPGGANVTDNISVTLVLALFTFVIVNVFGTKEYWKEIFWPEVPMWLKFPLPIMPAIEFVGMLTKPFALMIRLFANILAGHSIVLGLTGLIFVTVSMGPVINGTMTVVSVLLSVFIYFVELLVSYIQAYVFTMLSAVFIGLARVEPHHVEKN